MEKLKSITIIFLLAVGLLTSVAPAKTTSVLLQEGLYAEEIEGDLDAAIKIYEQVISESKKAQRTAAQATYRIGMCYLKKGEQAKAATQFSNLVSQFPEQKPIVDKARKQLSKLRPPTRVFEPQALIKQIKSGKVPSFEVQLHDNTALDLESGEISLLKDEWPDRFDVAWDNDGGGALMKKDGSGVRFLALPSGEKQMWDEAIYMARSDIDELRNSNTRGIWASQGKFAAVLTNEGNLAVIRIGDYDADKGTIYGWVEKIPAAGFGPVIERLIDSDETEKDIFFDLDTAQAYSFPPGLSRASPTSEKIEWSRAKGIDFANDRGRMELVDMTAVKIKSGMWESATPVEIRDALLKGTPQDFLPSHSKDYTISSPFTYAFETREGGIGLLQILEKKNEDLRIRYKMLQGGVENPEIANALSVAEAFLAAVVSGRDSEAIKLVKPGSAVVRQVKDFRGILDPEKLEIVSILADERIAVITTTEISAAATTKEISVEDKGPMLIRLIKQRGMWMVEDVDLETPASLKAEIDSFLQKHPNATKLQDVQFRYKMLQPGTVKDIVTLKLTKPAYEWWQSEPSVTNTIYEDSQLEIEWDVEPEMAKKILSFSGGVLPMKGDISDTGGHLWWVKNLAFTVRRTPYGKKWGITEGPKPLKSGEYRIYICAFDIKENIVWQDMLRKHLVGSATAKLIVKPRPSTQIATPREAKSPIDLSTPEAAIKSFVNAVYDGNLEAAKACVSKDGADYDEFMEMLATESNHPFQAMIKAMDASIPVEITSKDITEDRCKIKWYLTLGRVYYFGETKMKKGMHQEFSSYLELVGDKWLIRDI